MFCIYDKMSVWKQDLAVKQEFNQQKVFFQIKDSPLKRCPFGNSGSDKFNESAIRLGQDLIC